MYVCLCADVTQSDIIESITNHGYGFDELVNNLNVTQGCGMCESEVLQMLNNSTPSIVPIVEKTDE